MTSSGVPVSTTTPSSINTTRSETALAKSISWVTITIVIFSAASCFNSRRISAVISGSSAEVGSSKYNLSTPVKGNLNITCVYTATKKPGKAKVTFKAAKKSAKLRFKKLSNAKGYEIKYANNSKMKKAKTKTTTKSSIAIKKLKSGKKTYFRVRAYNLDSAGKKVYSKKVVKKSIVIK